MLIQIGRLRIGTQLFKRCLFYSTANYTESNAEECVLQPNDNLPSRAEASKFLKVAILGLPNAGKSTLINNLVQRTICPTSSKAHTTTYKAKAVYLEGDTQIVFIDTPGLTTHNEMKKFQLSKTFKNDPVSSIHDADIIGVLQDAGDVYTRHIMSRHITNTLNQRKENTPVILIFNKVDKLKDKKILLQLIRQLSKNEYIPKFDDIFMISALTGDGVNDLRNYLLDCAKKNQWQYEQNAYTDQSPINIVKQTVRAKLLDLLLGSVPYTIEVEVEHYDVNEDGTVVCVILLKCPKQYMKTILVRNSGEKLKLAAMVIENELRNAFKTNVLVRLIALAYSKEQNCYL